MHQDSEQPFQMVNDSQTFDIILLLTMFILANFQQASSNKSNDVLNQVFIVNTPSMGISSSTTAMPTAATTLNTSSSSTGDPCKLIIVNEN